MGFYANANTKFCQLGTQRPHPAQGVAVFLPETGVDNHIGARPKLTGATEAELPRSGWREMALWLIRRRRLFRVTGASMAPTLCAGAVVMLDPCAYRVGIPLEDEIVVAQHPRQADLWIVKRVAAVLESDAAVVRLVLSSDNREAGADSRAFGPVAVDLVLGRVTSRLR